MKSVQRSCCTRPIQSDGTPAILMMGQLAVDGVQAAVVVGGVEVARQWLGWVKAGPYVVMGML